MNEEEHPQVTEEQLLQEEVTNDIDMIIHAYEERKIAGMQLLGGALDAWGKAHTNPNLVGAIEHAMKEHRQKMHQLAGLNDIQRHGDPARKRYDPKYWMETMPHQFKGGKEEVFLLDRTKSLRAFLAGLSLGPANS